MNDSLGANVRSGTLEVLELLADLRAQRAYERDVPIEDVPAELVCMWFDDMHHPEDPAHHRAFDASERQVLAEFHEFFSKHVDDLPQCGDVAKLHATPIWHEIVSHAKAALRGFREAS